MLLCLKCQTGAAVLASADILLVLYESEYWYGRKAVLCLVVCKKSSLQDLQAVDADGSLLKMQHSFQAVSTEKVAGMLCRFGNFCFPKLLGGAS